MPKMMSTEQWINRAKEVWKDKYSYNNTIYAGQKHKVTITCHMHGDFEVLPNNHLTKNSGCPLCSATKRRTTETFVMEAIAKYGTQYDYSKVNFTGVDNKVTIICRDHGEFEITPYRHLNNAAGCPRCGHLKISISRLMSQQDYVEKATIAHNGLYSYENLTYTGIKDKVEIICHKHGSFFQTADNHLHLKHGCPDCDREFRNSAENKDRHTAAEFVKIATTRLGNKYDYSKVEYINNKVPITIICSIHGPFRQRPSNHLTGYEGCPECVVTGSNNGGYKYDLPGICYLMKFVFKDRLVYKIGITNRTVQERYCSSEFEHCIETWTKAFNVGKDAHTMEQTLLKKYKQYKYKGDPILKSGNTELLIGPIDGLEEEWK